MNRYLILALALLLFVATTFYLGGNKYQEIVTVDSNGTDFAYDNRTFLPAIASVDNTDTGPRPAAIILPHHLLASPLIAQGVQLLDSAPPDTIILLSPNHLNSGHCDISTSGNNWDTPFGQVQVSQEYLELFTRSGSVCLDDNALKREHGIAGIIPFIKYYLPNTKILPLAFKKDPDPETLFMFFGLLTSIDASNHAIIASLDFSHGLTLQESTLKDMVTENLINNFSFEDILKLSSEHIDSPPVLASYLKFIQGKQGTLNFIDHKTSAFYNGVESEVTSYFLISDSKVIEKETTIIFGGDVMLGRTVNTRMNKYQDFTWPFNKISETLKSSDLSIINLESPFMENCPLTDSGMVFCADSRSVEGLVFAGIDIANLANNHISNQGNQGFNYTLSLLDMHGIGAIGSGSAVIKTINDVKFSFLGFNDIPPYYSKISKADKDSIEAQVSQARQNSDVVIVSFHWGEEYRGHTPRQTEIATLAIKSGADVVVGHHPHWTQSSDSILGKPVYYSLGNLVFDQMWSESTRKGELLRLTFLGKNLIKEERIPITILDYGQPTVD